MFTFNHVETTMMVDEANADNALQFADKMLISIADGYWKRINEKEYTWTKIVEKTIPLYVNRSSKCIQ
jgi:hypothetical protein